jgi:hypothetical protein
MNSKDFINTIKDLHCRPRSVEAVKRDFVSFIQHVLSYWLAQCIQRVNKRIRVCTLK